MAAIKKPVPHHLCFADSLCWKKSTPLHSTSFDLASKRMADVFLSLLTTPICPITLKIEKEWELEWKKWCNWSVFYSNGRTDHSQLWVFSSCCLKHGGEWMGEVEWRRAGVWQVCWEICHPIYVFLAYIDPALLYNQWVDVLQSILKYSQQNH